MANAEPRQAPLQHAIETIEAVLRDEGHAVRQALERASAAVSEVGSAIATTSQ